MSYELIIFDMDGTLYKFDSSGKDCTIFETEFYKEIEQRGIVFIARRLSISPQEAQRTREIIFKKYAGNVSIGLEREYGVDRGDYFGFVWDVDPSKYIDSDGELRKLMQSLPFKKALLTTAPQVWARKVLQRLSIDDQFEGLWFGDGDIRKPDRRAYLQVVNSLNVAPEKALIVDDEPSYLKPAKELGIATVLIGSATAEWIDYCIPNIYGIKSIVGGKNATTTLKN